uniref:Sorting nexin 1, isoform B n=1 Tax=Drosophila melanogaster TaxID=7227 RepID=X2J8I7_DROME|nr:sorting nexin 1, isoform B [Drosophila melanogaster]AHN54101.1 sorting nexin 1, isoform B [Drosophila melanogaster]|eukprot:NP_001285586.1 sorting nexin 1, isoform B [Drosophila melanogaster]
MEVESPEHTRDFAEVDINNGAATGSEDEEEEVPAPGSVTLDRNESDLFVSALSPSSIGDIHPLQEVLTDDGDYFISIVVSDPQKIGDGMGSYLAYKVTTKTNIPKFKRSEFSTLRRFSDFLGIHDLLVGKYMRLGRIIPPAPSKNIIGSTKVKISPQQSEPGTPMTQEWVEIRRAALERFVHRTAQHPVLRVDLDFMNFLESDQELPRSVNTSALSGAGVIRLFNKVGETVNKITYKMDENDPWFDDKITEVESLDANLQKLHNAMKSLVTSRRELSLLTGLVAKSAAMLSTCEEHTGLSRALSNLADVEEKIELLRSEQANSDFFILAEFIKDYLGLFGAIKCIFHERVKAFQNWQYAQMQLSKRRENRGRFELANRADKLDQAQQEVDEGKVQRCQQQFDDISAEIKREMERFELTRVKDFKVNIIKYIEDQMAHQQQIVSYWEAFAPFAREIV